MAANDSITDIHEIAPPPEVVEPINAWLYSGLATAAIALVLFTVMFIRRRPPIADEAPGLEPRAEALDRLHLLKREHVTIPPIEFGARTVEALRFVLADRFGHHSLSLTTDEFFERHAGELAAQLDPDRAETLSDLLATCDKMRFAPDPDAPSRRLPLAESALVFVRDLPERTMTTPPSLAPADANPATA